jgi:hypothetical protein
VFIGTHPTTPHLVTRDKGFFEAEGLKSTSASFIGLGGDRRLSQGKVELVAWRHSAMRLCEVMGAKIVAPTDTTVLSVFMVKSSIKTQKTCAARPSRRDSGLG